MVYDDKLVDTDFNKVIGQSIKTNIISLFKMEQV